jgi:Ca2+-transporting ATPase
MGRRGTDVAREAAALVLLEDDFGSLVEAIRLGRRIYANIRAAMRYIVSVHVPTAGMALLPLAFGWPVVLLPLHIVFLEFVIDPACSIAFEAEPGEARAMERPPRDPAARLFDASLLAGAALLGALVLAGALGAYAWALGAGRAEDEARTLAFAAIVFGNCGLILAYRPSLKAPNPALWAVIGGALAALAAVIYFPGLAALFRFAPLPAGDAVLAALAGLSGCALWSLARLARRVVR